MNECNKDKLKIILMTLAKTEIRISYEQRDELLPVCSSKIGGKPAVPNDFKWPRHLGESFDNIVQERPLSFLAQINLEDINRNDTDNTLPKVGILSFFYEQISMPWGFDPNDKGCARVYYFPVKENLIPMNPPNDMIDEAVMPELAIRFKNHISIPEYEDFQKMFSDIEVDWNDYDECREECGCFHDEWGQVTKLLGYSDTIQSSMGEQCEALVRGYRQGCPEDYALIPKDIFEDIRLKSKDWMLLFQMGTIESDDFEYMFGDCGHIYFWIRKKDLKNKDFDKIWLILQCG